MGKQNARTAIKRYDRYAVTKHLVGPILNKFSFGVPNFRFADEILLSVRDVQACVEFVNAILRV